jgi:hypothetical protein
MKKLALTKERVLAIYARINETGVSRVLSFFYVDDDGVRIARNITSLNFELRVRKKDFLTELFTLSIGDGLTVGGASSNELTIDLSNTNATQKPVEHFYQLFSVAEDKTWLDGPFFFHAGEFDGVEETDEILIGENGEVVIEISSGGGNSISASSQAQVNAETSADTYVSPATLAAKALPDGTYSTVLTFDTDKDIYHDATGASITFTLGTGNINGKGIFLRLNKPTAVTFPGTFEASSSSATLDATKLNVYLLIFFTNWNGSGLDHVVYTNQTFTAL